MEVANIDEVKRFWNDNPCQSALSDEEDRRRYFEEVSAKRYGQDINSHIPAVARFEEWSGRDVLEIGIGVGTDAYEFARHGARYHGIDLTPAAVAIVQERFSLFGLEGEVAVANAEARLPFEDGQFDHIYSWGVLHHSPGPDAIAREMHRVLKDGGTFTVMLYNRASINYYIEIMLLRRLFRLLLYPRFMPRVIARLTGFDRYKLEGHRERLKAGRMTRDEWISMNTDGPECPLARVYSYREAAELFNEFRSVRQEVWGFDTDHWPFVRHLIPSSVCVRIGRWWGWHRIIYGTR